MSQYNNRGLPPGASPYNPTSSGISPTLVSHAPSQGSFGGMSSNTAYGGMAAAGTGAGAAAVASSSMPSRKLSSRSGMQSQATRPPSYATQGYLDQYGPAGGYAGAGAAAGYANYSNVLRASPSEEESPEGSRESHIRRSGSASGLMADVDEEADASIYSTDDM